MNKLELQRLYITERLSVPLIANRLNCSQSKINYWLKKFNITKRTISDAIYLKKNFLGDPFQQKDIDTIKKALLFGLGLGLYWGEGTKSNEYAIRLGNTDPYLIKSFIRFLTGIYSVDKRRLRYGLQLFNDSDPEESIKFWTKELLAEKSQFYKVIVSEIRGKGSYSKKSKHGVLTVYFHNRKLRNILISSIDNLKKS